MPFFSLYFLLYSVGEESYSSGTRPPLTDSPTFFVDPIGTFQVPRFMCRSHLTLSYLSSQNTLHKKNNRPLFLFSPRRTGTHGQMVQPILCMASPTRASPSA